MSCPSDESMIAALRSQAGDDPVLLAAVDRVEAADSNSWFWWSGDGHIVTEWGYNPMGLIRAALGLEL